MKTTLKTLHLLGLALFLGSVFGHIFLGGMAAPGDAAFAVLQQAKHQSTLLLTLPGLAVTVATGLALAITGGAARRRWLRLKAVLAAGVVVNGALVLSPAGEAIAALAPTGDLAARAPLLQREAMFGAVNLALVLAVVVLAVARPRLGERP